MDKSWIRSYDRNSNSYIEGIAEFLKFATHSARPTDGFIRCPCRDCLNNNWHSLNEVQRHLLNRGMAMSYVNWTYHGEPHDPSMHVSCRSSQTQHTSMQIEAEAETVALEFEVRDDRDIIEDVQRGVFFEPECEEDSDAAAKSRKPDQFERLIRDAQREAYPNCRRFSLLATVIRMLHIKVLSRQSVKSFNMWLTFVKELLPDGETLPASYYEAKKMLRELGLGYDSIHACKNDCVLYRKEFKDLNQCPQCNESRWKPRTGRGKKIPHKILRHFPLVPRLQRLFSNKKIASDMRWHKEKRIFEDDILRHPADSEAWKDFDTQFLHLLLILGMCDWD